MSSEYDADYVAHLLDDAAEYNLTWEVVMSALQYMKQDPTASEFDAIVYGYNEWVK